jgi:hypothetical protein
MCTRSAFIALAFLVFGNHSAFAQQDYSRPAGSCFLQIKGGSGATFYRVCVSPTGNLTRLESPLGVEHLNQGDAVDGWAVCREDGWSNAWDFDAGREGELESNTGEYRIKQPNGPGTLPLYIYHTLWAGLTVEQRISRQTVERELTVTMIVKNTSTVSIPGIVLYRMIDPDVDGNWQDDLWATTADSVLVTDGGLPGRGVSLTAGTRSIRHQASAGIFGSVHNGDQGGDAACYQDGVAGGAIARAAGDYVASVGYFIGTLKPGYSKTVTFIYRVF